MSGKYIDQTGLARVLTNLKENFATKTELNSSTLSVVYCDAVSGANVKGCDADNFTHAEGNYFLIDFENGNDSLHLSSAPIALLFSKQEIALPLFINGEISSSTNCTYSAGTYFAYDDGTGIYINTDGAIPGFAVSGGSATYMSDQEVIDILNDEEGTWTGLEKMTTLWQNASPTSTFTAQTVNTLSMQEYNFILFEYSFYNTENSTLFTTLAELSSIYANGILLNLSIAATGENRVGGRRLTIPSYTSVTFEAASYNGSTNNTAVIPRRIVGIKL